jgi:hypothetical protein
VLDAVAPQLDPAERQLAVVDAERAKARHEPDLRRLGAIGVIGIGLDPEQPTWRQWWARCLIGRTDTAPTPLLAQGYGTASEAMGALVELAARPRLT